jgi:pyruvate dehydrogenase E2 component (dihydrolipoamide acetyltransferase)
VSEGDEVERGQEIAEIETDKANMMYESDTAGTVVEIVVQEGATVPLGELIARIGEAGETGEKAESRKQKAEEAEAPEPQRQVRPSSNGSGDGERVKASPVARRMAEERGVDLASIEGSGPGGRVVKADVEAAAAEPEAAAPEAPEPAGDAGPKGDVQVQELTRLQRTVSRRMAESKATAPDYALEAEIDMTEAVKLRERLKAMTEKPPSFNDMIVRACALALRDHPRVNGAYRDGHFELYSSINIGVAVAAQDALVVPTVFDADKKSLGEISRNVRELAEKVRDGKITPPELSGGTFTVSNLGMYGIDAFTAVINPPQAAILAVGALKKRPAIDSSGAVVERDTMFANLVSDHRILYGADGAQFLARVRELLEEPLALAL